MSSAVSSSKNKALQTTVAEGIETDKQGRAVCKYGVDSGQGFLCSRPITEQETLDLFQKQL